MYPYLTHGNLQVVSQSSLPEGQCPYGAITRKLGNPAAVERAEREACKGRMREASRSCGSKTDILSGSFQEQN